MEIRKAGMGDLEAVARMENRLHELHVEYSSYYSPAPGRKGAQKKHLREVLESDDWLVLVAEEERAVGFLKIKFEKRPPVFAERSSAKFSSIFVEREWRGKGIGTRLVERGLAELGKRGVEWAEVFADVENPAAQLYEEMGFEPRQTRMVKRLA